MAHTPTLYAAAAAFGALAFGIAPACPQLARPGTPIDCFEPDDAERATRPKRIAPVPRATSAEATPDDRPATAGELEDWRTMLADLETLWSGTAEERIEIAVSSAEHFEPLEAPPGELRESAAETVASLQTFLEVETDEWVLDRLARGLSEIGGAGLDAMFRGALEHPSPNVRRRAVRRFGEVDDRRAVPALERLWKTEQRPWVRADLIAALARNDSKEIDGTCLDLVDSTDPTLARAAIDCVVDRAPADALPALVRALRGAPPARRPGLLVALARSSDAQRAVAALLEAARSADPTTRVEAVAALGMSRAAEAREHLLLVAHDAGEERLERAAAIGGLQAAREPGTCALIASMDLRNGTPESAVLMNAYFRGTFGFDADAFGEPEIAWLVAPRDGASSARCREAPNRPGIPEDFPRVPARMPIEIGDRFEIGGETWVEPAGFDCWLPAGELFLREAPVLSAIDPRAAEELDVEWEELETPLALALIERGLLETFDPADRVVGLRFLVRTEKDALSFLEAFTEHGDAGATLLGRAVHEFARGVTPPRAGN